MTFAKRPGFMTFEIVSKRSLRPFPNTLMYPSSVLTFSTFRVRNSLARMPVSNNSVIIVCKRLPC